ncbi:MAG: Rieske (2Fe-2S) domain protein [Polaromonas sp.]|nr:Rieske (2Fe-2S) domain protein [Polaromonas sp.]
MSTAHLQELESLVQDDRVHRSVYSDPDIFEMEMRQLFGKAWLILGHESQVARAGDYFCTEMARQPVIVSRTEDGAVHVLFNRCPHRGAMVCHEQSGNAKQFVCPYHGWAFEPNGHLRFVPIAHNYGDDFAARMPGLNLTPVPRVDSYRGFIFASLAAQGPSLLEFLGHMTSSFDDLVDRSPTGEIEVAGGVFKHAYNGNWKLVLENHNDTVHPAFVHASSVYAAGGADQAASTPVSDISIRQMRQNGASSDVWEKLGLWTAGAGHSYMGDYHDDKRLVAGLNNPVFEEYAEALTARLGGERTHDVLSVSRFNSIVYPNCSFMSQFRQLRIVHPVAVDRTVVYTYSFRMKGAPPALFQDTVAFGNVVNGTASWVLTDDLEVYERAQKGLTGQLSEWVYLGRGFGQDTPDEHGMLRGGTGTSEIHIRQQFAAWKAYMTGGAA